MIRGNIYPHIIASRRASLSDATLLTAATSSTVESSTKFENIQIFDIRFRENGHASAGISILALLPIAVKLLYSVVYQGI